MKKRLITMTMAMLTVSMNLTACTSGTTNDGENAVKVTNADTDTQWLGEMSPEDALEYMKTTPDLVIIDVREPQYINQSFKGEMQIPWTKMAERCDEIPAEKNVLLHCGLGMVVPNAYRILQEKRTDLKSVAYIAGAPLFKEYNEWLKANKKK